MQALVIDDSRAMRSILKKMLQDLGFQVSEAGNGREGLLRLTESGKLDLVMVDWNMPEMNGLEFVKAARANPAFATVPMMMVTTETEMSSVVKAMEAGANEYVMKPFTKEVILEKLHLLGLSL